MAGRRVSRSDAMRMMIGAVATNEDGSAGAEGPAAVLGPQSIPAGSGLTAGFMAAGPV